MTQKETQTAPALAPLAPATATAKNAKNTIENAATKPLAVNNFINIPPLQNNKDGEQKT